MSRLLLAGLVVAGWAAAGIGQTSPDTPPVTTPSTGTPPATGGLTPIPSTTAPSGGVVQAGVVGAPGGVVPTAYTTSGPISGVVIGNCGLTPAR